MSTGPRAGQAWVESSHAIDATGVFMGSRVKLRQVPERLAVGAFLLNSGITKLKADEETAKALHGFATGTYPFLGKLKPEDFAKLLGAGEITLGAALLIPAIPGFLAGAGLAAFSGGLLGLYAMTPGMRKPGSALPSQEGIAIAKDSWLLGIGLSLILDDLA
jgi:hypothetical protein